PSQVPGAIEPTPSGPPKQQVPTSEGAPKQEQPLGVGGEEPAPIAPAVEGQASKEALPTQVPPSENNAPKLSPAATEPRQIIDLTKHDDGKLHHPLSKHSGMPFDFLDNRLKTEPHITGASTFHNHDEANKSVQLVLDRRASEIKAWLANPKLKKPQPFELTHSDIGPDHGSIGLVLERTASALKPGAGVRIILRKDATMPEGFRVKTAYPIP
ncbi:MAG: Rhs family protein, partial [Actinomycetia bacterium]|nr:Rhs family protein [Actinomycetes bacterium]